MRSKIMAMALVAMLGVALAGCQTSSGYYDPAASAAGGMLGGAAGGAALGAIIGAATGNPGAGAWIGAATGAGVGAIGGSLYANDQNMARARAAQGAPPPGYGPPQGYGSPQGYGPPPGYGPAPGYGPSPGYGPAPGYGPSSYSSSQGSPVAIDQAQVNPANAQPGGQIMLSMNYRVTSPRNQPVTVQLVREIRKDGQLIDQPYEESRRVHNGANAARVAYRLPTGAPPGDYVATFRVVSNQWTSEKSVNFLVQ